MKDLEHIYDEQIAPLMAQIIKIAEKHEIPYVASFQLADEETDEQGVFMCTSCLLPDGCSEKLQQAKKILYAPSSASMLTLTTKDADGVVQAIESIINEQGVPTEKLTLDKWYG